jgi:hypothetical protein
MTGWDHWNYEYGGVKKRTILSKANLVLRGIWFVPFLCGYILWDYLFGDEE